MHLEEDNGQSGRQRMRPATHGTGNAGAACARSIERSGLHKSATRAVREREASIHEATRNG